jgi:hypothetical protein
LFAKNHFAVFRQKLKQICQWNSFKPGSLLVTVDFIFLNNTKLSVAIKPNIGILATKTSGHD